MRTFPGLILRRFVALVLMNLSLTPSSTQATSLPGVDEAVAYSSQTPNSAIIIVQGSTVLAESYSAPATAETSFRLASIAKNVWGITALAAVQDGWLRLDEHVGAVISEWHDLPGKKAVHVRNLLNMNSGLNPGFQELYGATPPNSHLTAVGLPMKHGVGEFFEYGPANMEVFGEFFRRRLAARKLTPLTYVERRLFAPLGVTYDEWKQDDAGNLRMSAGIKMTARNLLRLGEFVLHRGIVHQKHLIAADLFNELAHGSPSNRNYSLTFWLNRSCSEKNTKEEDVERILASTKIEVDWNSICFAHDAPSDMLVMLGSGNKRVYIVPSLNTVIVRLADDSGFRDNVFWSLLSKSPQRKK